jgi:large subunit ribosomal protein L33
MGGKKIIMCKLLSTAETGFFYVFKKSSRYANRKLSFIKYDPLVQGHVLFQESKLASGKKRSK